VASTFRWKHNVLSPIASDSVTTIVGFTELSDDGRLYNTAAVFHRGTVAGSYRKQHPAINRSVYAAGCAAPVFHVGGLSFGIVICNDSNFVEPARRMAARGATALFVPTNNGLPWRGRTQRLWQGARNADLTRALESRVCVIRADLGPIGWSPMDRQVSSIRRGPSCDALES
jgi:predicted amidohydrolase